MLRNEEVERRLMVPYARSSIQSYLGPKIGVCGRSDVPDITRHYEEGGEVVAVIP
jgi:hypothetical protein